MLGLSTSPGVSSTQIISSFQNLVSTSGVEILIVASAHLRPSAVNIAPRFRRLGVVIIKHGGPFIVIVVPVVFDEDPGQGVGVFIHIGWGSKGYSWSGLQVA